MEVNPNWLVAPIVIPMICAALGLTARRWSYPHTSAHPARLQRRP